MARDSGLKDNIAAITIGKLPFIVPIPLWIVAWRLGDQVFVEAFNTQGEADDRMAELDDDGIADASKAQEVVLDA